jgi:DnaJ-class molecular chaperone
MITKENYEKAKMIVDQYESEQRFLKKFVGESTCPFCGGTKTLPLLPNNMGKQNCTECNSQGMISNKKLVTMGLEDFITKKS